MNKISDYKQLERTCEKILQRKGTATASDISKEIIDNYKNTRNIKTSPKKISNILKMYPKQKNNKGIFIFSYDNKKYQK